MTEWHEVIKTLEPIPLLNVEDTKYLISQHLANEINRILSLTSVRDASQHRCPQCCSARYGYETLADSSRPKELAKIIRRRCAECNFMEVWE